jgi:hypothetical protein
MDCFIYYLVTEEHRYMPKVFVNESGSLRAWALLAGWDIFWIYAQERVYTFIRKKNPLDCK